MLQIISLSNPLIAQQLYALQRAAYQVESELIEYPHLPPLRESFAEFQQSGEQWLVWIEQQEIMGALAFVQLNDRLDICRLIVSPHHFRQGIARQLLMGLEQIYQEMETITVSTAARNEPAIKLYYSQEYQLISQSLTPDGLGLVHLQKNIHAVIPLIAETNSIDVLIINTRKPRAFDEDEQRILALS